MAQRMSSRKSSRLPALLVSSLVLVALSAGLVPVHDHEYHAARSCTLCSTGTPPATTPSIPQRIHKKTSERAFPRCRKHRTRLPKPEQTCFPTRSPGVTPFFPLSQDRAYRSGRCAEQPYSAGKLFLYAIAIAFLLSFGRLVIAWLLIGSGRRKFEWERNTQNKRRCPLGCHGFYFGTAPRRPHRRRGRL